jgi:hypothetical protein
MAVCSFSVTVVDNQAPVITCKPSTTKYVDKGAPKYTVVGAEFDATATDNCGTVSLTYTLSGATSGTGTTLAGVQLNKGATTITWVATDPRGNSSTCSTTVTVTKRQTQLIVNAATPVQYSDNANLSAKLNYDDGNYGDPTPTWKPLGGKTVSLSVNAQNTGGISDNTTGVASGVLQILQAPNTYNINGSFAGDDSYESSAGVKTAGLPVSQEDARVDYTGDQILATATATATTATVTLRANIFDITVADPTDPNAGDIRNAKVKFVNRDGSGDISGWIPVTTLVNASDSKVGTVSYPWSVNIGSADALETTVGIIVDNGYYVRNSQADNVVVTVYKPNGDFITGGGYIVPTKSVGSMKGDAGSKTNFGFNVKFNKSGTNLQGNLNFIFRRTEADGKQHVYQVKSNAMQSLGVNASNLKRQTANFVSKGNITDITNPTAPIALGGNKYMYINMVDNGEPGTKDSISFVLVNGTDDPTVLANIIYSSNWTGTKTEMMNLTGGNLVVHSGFNLGSSSNAALTITTNTKSSEPALTVQQPTTTFDLKASPNPTTSQFNVQIQSSDAQEKVQLRVIDLNGRTVQVLDGLSAGQAIQLGANYRPGMYIIEMIQGRNHKQLKLLKQPD